MERGIDSAWAGARSGAAADNVAPGLGPIIRSPCSPCISGCMLPAQYELRR